MTSSSSTRNSSKLAATTKPSSKHQWHSQPHNTHGLVPQHTATEQEAHLLVEVLHPFSHKREEAIRLRDSTRLVSLAQLQELLRIGSKLAVDGQPPNHAVPYTNQPPQTQSGFQPPYPISSPPPQSHTPANFNQHQPPPSQIPDGYPSYPPTSAISQAPPSRQSHPSEAYSGYPPQHTTIQPPNITQLQLHEEPGQDYPPSNYSMDNASNHQPSYPPLMSQAQAPPSSTQYPPSQPPTSDDYHAPMSPPPPSHGPPPIPQGGPPPDPSHRPITPLAQSSAYPTFSPGQGLGPGQQYQAYNQRPTSYYR